MGVPCFSGYILPQKGMRSMAKSSRVHVEIRGRGFNLLSDDNPDYIRNIADMVNTRMTEVIERNPQLTFEKAALLTALNFCDDFEKYKNTQRDDHVRAQLMEYAKELSSASEVIKNLERELAEAKQSNDAKLEQIKREYELKEKEIMDMIDSM